MAHGDAGDHVDVCGLELLTETRCKVMIRAPDLMTIKDKEVTFAEVSTIADSQLRMRDIEGFCDNLSPLH